VAAFYLDNDVPTALAPALQAYHHRVMTTRGHGQGRAGDHEQLATAAQRGEILVTCNRSDFFLLHDAWLLWPKTWKLYSPREHAGILVIPQLWPVDQAALELDHFASAHLQGIPNQCYRYRSGTGWEERR
jgi:hypothetical protein